MKHKSKRVIQGGSIRSLAEVFRRWAIVPVVLAAFALSAGVAHAEASDTQVQQAVISVNQADAATLAEVMSGIGEARAQAIVTWREQNGPFTSLEQLTEIKGIGAATLEKNRHKLSL